MAFLIPDNLKSRRDVTAGIRRTANAFQVALDENVCVWFEPLFDPSGQKPHFVLLFPDKGIIILEALDADMKAIIGVLRKRLRLLRDGQEVEYHSPLERAENLANILYERINAEERLANLDLNISCGAVFPSMTREEAESKGISRILSLDYCLFKPDLDAAINSTSEGVLLRAFNRMFGGKPNREIPDDKVEILRGIIQPEIVIDKVAGQGGLQLTIFRPPDDGENVLRIMDRQQEAMAKSLGEGHRVIRGVAGSGKTLVLVYRAKLLAAIWPNKRILVTCYTRSLAGELRYLLREHQNVDVVNLDRLMASTIRSAKLKHPGYNNDDSGEAVALAALRALEIRAPQRYRAVLIDEAQDFGTTALQFALKLLQPGHEEVLIVADAAQNIFRRSFSWRQAGIQAQGRTRILRVNYRNTKQILEFAHSFLMGGGDLIADDVPDPEDENAVIPPESAAREGSVPKVQICSDVQCEVLHTINQVVEWLSDNSTPRIIAVLYASSGNRNDERAKQLYSGLIERGIDIFWLNDPDDKDARDRLATVTSPVILSTIHSAKGLEFPYVVICGLWRDSQDKDSNRRLAYVGMTRAAEHLAVIVRQEDPLAKDLECCQS